MVNNACRRTPSTHIKSWVCLTLCLTLYLCNPSTEHTRHRKIWWGLLTVSLAGLNERPCLKESKANIDRAGIPDLPLVSMCCCNRTHICIQPHVCILNTPVHRNFLWKFFRFVYFMCIKCFVCMLLCVNCLQGSDSTGPELGRIV